MERKSFAHRFPWQLLFAICLCAAASGVSRVSAQDGSEANRSIARARALIAVGKLDAATAELEDVRRSANDTVVRDVASIMLMGAQLERGDYGRAQLLLDEAFNLRTSRGERSKQFYFALAGQLMNGARARLERFRQFGLNVRADDLPDEARRDLDQLRQLLEHVIEQAQRIRAEGGNDSEAAALIEDAAGARMALARSGEERAAWQARVAQARQWLVIAEPRLASLEPLGSSGLKFPERVMSGPVSSVTTDAPMAAESEEIPSKPSAGRNSELDREKERSGAMSQARRDEAAEGGNGSIDELKDVGVGLIARAVQRVSPIYPAPAKAAHVTGTVIVYLIVGEDGTVEKVVRSTGPALLRQAAEEAARRWRFRTEDVNGKRVRLGGFISFSFSL